MGRVKQWGFDRAELLFDVFVALGMDEKAAHDRAMQEVFGEDWDDHGWEQEE